MEIFDSITNILSLLFGGSIISIVTWRFARRKAYAEAKRAEAEAKEAEAKAAQERQNYYQQLVDDIAKDRDYYKQERDELRDKLDKLTRSVMDWKQTSEDERCEMKRDIARLGRQQEAMRPFMCGDMQCKARQRVTRSDDGIVSTRRPKKHAEPAEIDPINSSDL